MKLKLAMRKRVTWFARQVRLRPCPQLNCLEAISLLSPGLSDSYISNTTPDPERFALK